MTITATAPRAAAYRGRLRWWTELPLIAVVYALYSGARLVVRGDVDDAVEHGADILHLEQLLHLDPERFFNRLFTHHAFLGVPADFAYASLHYIVTPGVLIWLWHRRPTHYRIARAWLMISTLIGLVGFTLVPTAPPRLVGSGHGFIDTMAQYGSYGWWGTDASAPRGMGHLTNQYAAMPSLHFGWSLWCGIMLFRYGRHRVVRVLGVLYPLVTALVVMGTANHYLLDVLAGGTVMGIGYLLAPPALRLVDRLQDRVRGAAGPAARETAAPATGTAAAPSVTPAETTGATATRVVPAPRRGDGDATADSPDPAGGAAARGGEHAGHGRMS
jgi:PAP2 superfamily